MKIIITQLLTTMAALKCATQPTMMGGTVTLSVSGIAMAFAALVTLTALASNAWRSSAPRGLGIAIAVTCLAFFCTSSVLAHLILLELIVLPMAMLILSSGSGGRRSHATRSMVVYALAPGALAGIPAVVLSYNCGIDGGSALGLSGLAMALWCVALLAKIPVWPLHAWLPEAHVEADSVGSAWLAALILKLAAFSWLRLCSVWLSSGAYAGPGHIVATWALVSGVLGGAAALAQSDVKRTIAYSSVAHMGVSLSAACLGSLWGITASAWSLLGHGIVAAALFLMVGHFYERAGTRSVSIIRSLAVGPVIFMSWSGLLLANAAYPVGVLFWAELGTAVGLLQGHSLALFALFLLVGWLGVTFSAVLLGKSTSGQPSGGFAGLSPHLVGARDAAYFLPYLGVAWLSPLPYFGLMLYDGPLGLWFGWAIRARTRRVESARLAAAPVWSETCSTGSSYFPEKSAFALGFGVIQHFDTF